MENILEIVLEDIKKQFAESGFSQVCTGMRCSEEMVPMRDGIRLHTYIYRPEMKKERFPVILQRTCYPFWDRTMKQYGEELARRGYVYIYQYCRGQEQSQGVWEPNIHEREDGIDTVTWIAQQSWAGRIGVWGNSYGALIGWAMADEGKGLVSSMMLGVYGTDRYVSAYQKRAFRHDILTSWTMENAGYPIQADYLDSCRYMPQAEVDTALWGKRLDWYRDYILNDSLEDAYWQSGWWKQLREIPDKAEIPLYIISGWYDHHHGSTMASWNRLSARAKEHSRLEIGGWNHFGHPCLENRSTDNGKKEEVKSMLRWFESTLAEGRLPEGGVRLYEIGKDCWREYENLEAIKTRNQIFYLDAAEEKGILQKNKPCRESGRSYVYNPQNPVMSHGGEALLKSQKEIGSLRQPKPDWREDVLSFVSEPLQQELCIFGKIQVRLYVESSCEDTAFTAKVMEVNAQGEAYNIRSSITTIGGELEPGSSYTPGTPIGVTVEMWDILYTLKQGSRLRVDISSSDFPQYHVHSNYPGNWAGQEKTQTARQKLLCGGRYPSAVVIPTPEGE